MHHFNLLLVKLIRIVNEIPDKCSSFAEDVIPQASLINVDSRQENSCGPSEG